MVCAANFYSSGHHIPAKYDEVPQIIKTHIQSYNSNSEITNEDEKSEIVRAIWVAAHWFDTGVLLAHLHVRGTKKHAPEGLACVEIASQIRMRVNGVPQRTAALGNAIEAFIEIVHIQPERLPLDLIPVMVDLIKDYVKIREDPLRYHDGYAWFGHRQKAVCREVPSSTATILASILQDVSSGSSLLKAAVFRFSLVKKIKKKK